VQVTLSPEEWKLVSALRIIPESPLKERLDALFDELLRFAADPKCAESQADGVPCTSTAADCESCRRVTDLIDLLRRRVSAA
jgi:hypothetical protein